MQKLPPEPTDSSSPAVFEVVVCNIPSNTLVSLMDQLVAALVRSPAAGTEAGVEAGEGPEPGPGPGPSTRWLVVAGFPASEEAVVMEAVLSEVAAQAGDAAARRAEVGVEREYEAGWALLAVPVALDPPRVTN